MGATYLLYTEMLIDGEWRCINPLIKNYDKKSGREADEYKLSYTYWSGSRSGFGSTADRLRQIARQFKRNELSPELQKEFKEENEFGGQYLISYEDLLGLIPRNIKHQYHGFMHKDDVFRFETEFDVWNFDSVTSEEYMELPEEMRQLYQYYEWDDPDDWFCHVKSIIDKVQAQLYFFNAVNYLKYESCEKRIVFFEYC